MGVRFSARAHTVREAQPASCTVDTGTYILINLLGRYARVVDHLAIRDVAQGAPLGGGSTLHPSASGDVLGQP